MRYHGDPPKEVILKDYEIVLLSRECSYQGRKEVFLGKGKFGIFGDGKELPQVVLSHFFKKGDFRSGYYRDQTILFAQGVVDPEKFFTQLYADITPGREIFSGARQANNQYATPLISKENGEFTTHVTLYNHVADLAPIAAQMPRVLGLVKASTLYKKGKLDKYEGILTQKGSEVIFATTGNAGCAEGLFWETINALGIMGGPAVISIWDDGYGISVPNEYQITKSNISDTLRGFIYSSKGGYYLFRVKGWDYLALISTYKEAESLARRDRIPVIVHVEELTQPQGHSTSGSHERYKSKKRLEWEKEFDCIKKFKEWILTENIAREDHLIEIEKRIKERVKKAKERAWEKFQEPIRKARKELVAILENQKLDNLVEKINKKQIILYRDLLSVAREARFLKTENSLSLTKWIKKYSSLLDTLSSHLYSETPKSPLKVKEVKPLYYDTAESVYGYEILQQSFDSILFRYPEVVIFGEDVGKLGDVNQGTAGLQEKYGDDRVFDTGIREATILGEAIGLAMRGFRPIAEIQYLDYLLYALQLASDDLASLRYRTAGIQAAPVIIRTRGHRLEGIWHTGSPMGALISLLQGVWICVPRNMTKAAGFYNTLLQGDDPALVIEVLNSYRLKEPLPSNISDITTPLGIPEILRHGKEVTVVTYGACCSIALEAAKLLSKKNIEIEVIDIQTLLPLDREGIILDSIKKTKRLLIVDEDVPGGASAFILDQLLKRGAFWWLDSEPITLTASEHRTPYGSDGDYISKPNKEDILEAVLNIIHKS